MHLPNVKNGAVVLCGGGVDSNTILALYQMIGMEVYPLHVDYGQPSAKAEFEAISRIVTNLGLEKIGDNVAQVKIELPFLDFTDMKNDITVYNRNMILISIASAYAESWEVPYVAIGTHRAGAKDLFIFNDATEDFITKMGSATQAVNGIEILAPLQNLTKDEVFELANKMSITSGVDVRGSSFWCMNPVKTNIQCGECVKCLDMKKYCQSKVFSK